MKIEYMIKCIEWMVADVCLHNLVTPTTNHQFSTRKLQSLDLHPLSFSLTFNIINLILLTQKTQNHLLHTAKSQYIFLHHVRKLTRKF